MLNLTRMWESIKEFFLLLLILVLCSLVFMFVILGVVYLLYLMVILIKWVSTGVQLINSEAFRTMILSKIFLFFFKVEMTKRHLFGALYDNEIVFRLRTFFQRVLHSNSFYPEWYTLLSVMAFVGAVATILFFRRVVFVFQKLQKNAEDELTSAEYLLVVVTVYGSLVPLVLVSKKIFFYSLDFFQKVLHQMMRDRIGAALLCGFIGAAKEGYLRYLFVVPRFFFDDFEDSFFFEHHQKRVAAITSFFLGQCFRFFFFYKKGLFESLYKAHWLMILFFTFFLFQVAWTRETIVKNWKYLYKHDKRKRVVKRTLFLQFDFVANFLIQLLRSDFDLEILQPNSMVSILFERYLEDKVFVGMSFFAYFLGHIVLISIFLKIFQLVMIWVYPKIKYIFGGGSDSNRKGGGWDLFRYN